MLFRTAKYRAQPSDQGKLALGKYDNVFTAIR